MNLSRNYIGALLIALAGILFWVLLLPAYDTVMAQREAVTERASILKDRADTIASIKTMTQEYITRATDIERFTSIVPAKKSVPEIVSSIQALSFENGLQLTTVTLSGGANKGTDPYLVQSIDLGLTGSYPAFKSFLMALEKNIRLIDVVSIDASPIAENSSIISFRIRGNAYYLNQ